MRLLLTIALSLGLVVPAMAQDKAPPPPPASTETPETSTPAPVAPTAEAPAPEAPKPEITKNGDWFVGCQEVMVEGKPEKACEMQQILEETNSGQAFIRISVIYPRNSKKPVLRILTPLGVLLQKGLVLTIDNGKPITLPFAICVGKPPSCIVDGIMEDSIVNAMKRGNAGTLSLSFGNNQSVDAPFSLSGFTKSITSIQR